ncbi:30S ribosome-binding factor RbfA [Pseudoroseicyclus sp. H15]
MSRRHSSDTSGPSQRQLRVGELVRRALADILMRRDVHDEVLGRSSITVGEVRCTPDLKQATAFVLPLGGEDAEGVLAALRRNKSEIRHQVAKHVDLKYAPDLKFEIDGTFDKMDETRRLLNDERVRRDVEG